MQNKLWLSTLCLALSLPVYADDITLSSPHFSATLDPSQAPIEAELTCNKTSAINATCKLTTFFIERESRSLPESCPFHKASEERTLNVTINPETSEATGLINSKSEKPEKISFSFNHQNIKNISFTGTINKASDVYNFTHAGNTDPCDEFTTNEQLARATMRLNKANKALAPSPDSATGQYQGELFESPKEGLIPRVSPTTSSPNPGVDPNLGNR